MRKLPVLEGWRYEVFGRDALELVEGRLGFGVEKGRLKMTRIDRETQAEAEQAQLPVADDDEDDTPFRLVDDDAEDQAAE